MEFGAIVMAAGLGTRMKSDLPKVLHPLCGKPMIVHVLDLLVKAHAKKVAIVVSYHKEAVIQIVSNTFPKQVRSKTFVFVDQKKPLGTGHAVLRTQTIFKSFSHPIAILSGDVPTLTLETFQNLLLFSEKSQTELTLATAILDPKTPYGRVIRDLDDKVSSIIETKDATREQCEITEMNVGLYCVQTKPLFTALKKITTVNAKHEYYLTDMVRLIPNKEAFIVENADEVLGINSRDELAMREAYMRQQINTKWMQEGVTMKDPKTTYIGMNVVLKSDVILEPMTTLEGTTHVDKGAHIGFGSIIRDSKLGMNVTIKEYCVIEQSQIDDFATVGPFARLRPESHLKRHARVGNFVELKKTVLGEESKANHLSYLGDATIGKNVNIGCGVITCNYDGGLKYKGKAKTVIGDHSFVGSDCQLIAPMVLKKGAYVASGTTVTQNIHAADSLVIGRTPLVIKKGYMKKLWAKAKRHSMKKEKS